MIRLRTPKRPRAGEGSPAGARAGGSDRPAPRRRKHRPRSFLLLLLLFLLQPPLRGGGGGSAMQGDFSLADCDVMGFDLDHTLCRYHLPQSARVSAVRRDAVRPGSRVPPPLRSVPFATACSRERANAGERGGRSRGLRGPGAPSLLAQVLMEKPKMINTSARLASPFLGRPLPEQRAQPCLLP